MMKLAAVVAISAALLLATTINMSYEDGGVKVYAKEKHGKVLVLVKNGMTKNLHGITLTLLDGKIDSIDGQRWTVSRDSANQVTLSSGYPITPNGRDIFFISTQNIYSIISWTAKDKTGSIMAMDNARPLVKEILNEPKPLDWYVSGQTVKVTTDRIFYNKGDNMFITGVLEPNSKITITIYTPSGQRIKIGDETDQKGFFNALHVLRDAESGTYLIKASEPKSFAETTFKVM